MKVFGLLIFTSAVAVAFAFSFGNVNSKDKVDELVNAAMDLVKSNSHRIDPYTLQLLPINVDFEELKFNCKGTDLTIKGLNNVSFNKRTSPGELSTSFDIIYPSLVGTGKYDVKGTYGSLNISGNGDVSVGIMNYVISVDAKFEKYTIFGNTFYQATALSLDVHADQFPVSVTGSDVDKETLQKIENTLGDYLRDLFTLSDPKYRQVITTLVQTGVNTTMVGADIDSIISLLKIMTDKPSPW